MRLLRYSKTFVLLLGLLFIGGQLARPASANTVFVDSASLAQATAAPENATATPAIPAPTSFQFSLPSSSLFLDTAWYKQRLIVAADLWNGGLDGQSGMGAYKKGFDGYFMVNLDRQWRSQRGDSTTIIAQSRAIYMNVDAYRTAGPADGQRFLTALNRGVEYLLAHFKDSELGGFFWQINPDGTVKDPQKQGYGNVHPLLALTQAYSVTQNPVYLQAALEQLDVLKKHFLDPQYPGGIFPGFNKDFSQIMGVNNVDTFTHYFEALLALYDVTTGQTQTAISQMITTAGDFLVNRLYTDQAGFMDRGYVAYNYDKEWKPSQQPYSRQTQWSGALQATTGHCVELAYLLSRAIERGFNPDWLKVAQKLFKFCEVYAFDAKYGAMIYDITDYDGKPLQGNPDNKYFIWWAQMESARVFLHMAVVRNWDTAAAFKKIEYFIHNYQTDHDYGGLYSQLYLDSSGTPVPDMLYKGNIWKTNYHFSMFMSEALRLSEKYKDRTDSLNAQVQTKP